jgi:hypothetical protein
MSTSLVSVLFITLQLALLFLLHTDMESLHTVLTRLSSAKVDLAAQLAELASAQVVPRVRRELELCAGHTALFIVSRNLTALRHCTTVPMPRKFLAPAHPSSASHFFLTSAHCFFDSGKAWAQLGRLASIFHNDKEYPHCQLVSPLARLGTGQVLDLAVVACPKALPVAPPALSLLSSHAASHEAVAMAGFSLGMHSEETKQVQLPGASSTYALHVRMTRLSSSLQLLSPAEGALPRAVAGSNRTPPFYGFSMVQGFLEDRSQVGMSGGPVLDVHCRVLGTIERQSPHGQGGAYVSLNEPRVQLWVAEVVANDW